MKTWIKATAVVALMGIAGFAQGKPAGEKPLKGKIVSVTPEKDKPDTLDIVVSAGGKKNAHEVTVTADATMKVKIDGQDKLASDLAAGENVTITPSTGTPTSIEATNGHKKKAATAPAV